MVTIQVAKNLVGRTADEDNEFPQGTHLDRRRVAFEPLYMRASGGALWSRPSGASAVILAKRVSHKTRRDACASRSEWESQICTSLMRVGSAIHRDCPDDAVHRQKQCGARMPGSQEKLLRRLGRRVIQFEPYALPVT